MTNNLTHCYPMNGAETRAEHIDLSDGELAEMRRNRIYEYAACIELLNREGTQ